MIFLFSSTVLSYGNFSRGLRGGPYLYCLPPLPVLLDAGADGAAAAVFFRACLRGGGEGLRRAGAAGAAAGLFRLAGEAEKELVGCSGTPAQAEKEAECRHVTEKEAECPDRHSPEEEAVEEAECPDTPEEEETEASSSEG